MGIKILASFICFMIVCLFGYGIYHQTDLLSWLTPGFITPHGPTNLPQVLGEKITSLPSITPQLSASTPTLKPTATVLPSHESTTLTFSPTPKPTSPIITHLPSPTSQSGFPAPVATHHPNQSFNSDLTTWDFEGHVQLKFSNTYVRECQNANFDNLPGFDRLIQLGSEESFEPLGAHVMGQNFVSDTGVAGVEFWFRVWTWETTLGFDDPVLMVLLNDQVVWRVSSAVALNSEFFQPEIFQPACSGWQKAVVPFPDFDFKFHTFDLKFLAGQTGDDQNPSWVEIGGINLLNEKTDLVLTTSWPEIVHFSKSAETQIGFFSIPEPSGFVDLSQLIISLQSPVQTSLYELHQPLTEPYQINLLAPKFINISNYILSDSFPFSLSHEGFEPALSLPVATGWSELSDFKPGWVMVANLWKQPLIVLPILLIQNGLL